MQYADQVLRHHLRTGARRIQHIQRGRRLALGRINQHEPVTARCGQPLQDVRHQVALGVEHSHPAPGHRIGQDHVHQVGGLAGPRMPSNVKMVPGIGNAELDAPRRPGIGDADRFRHAATVVLRRHQRQPRRAVAALPLVPLRVLTHVSSPPLRVSGGGGNRRADAVGSP